MGRPFHQNGEEAEFDLRTEVGKIQTQLSAITAAIEGNPRLGYEGLVGQTKDHRKRIIRLETYVTMCSGAVAVLTVLWAIFIHFDKFAKS